MKLNIYQVYTNLKNLILKLINEIRELIIIKLENKFNTTYSEFLEALSFGSFILILFRLCYRILYWGYNPAWYINLIVFLVAIIIGLKYSAYDYVREGAVTYIYKPLLGYDYYKDEMEEENNLNINYVLLYNRPEILNWRNKIKEKYIFKPVKEYRVNHKLYIKLYEMLIGIRLFIVTYSIHFIIINFIILSLLISNKYLILASFISIILFLSRLTFHLTDINMEEFLIGIKVINSNTAEKFYVSTTKTNIEILGYWIARSFRDRELYYAIKLERQIQRKKNKVKFKNMLATSALTEKNKYLYYKVIKNKAKYISKYLLNYTLFDYTHQINLIKTKININFISNVLFFAFILIFIVYFSIDHEIFDEAFPIGLIKVFKVKGKSFQERIDVSNKIIKELNINKNKKEKQQYMEEQKQYIPSMIKKKNKNDIEKRPDHAVYITVWEDRINIHNLSTKTKPDSLGLGKETDPNAINTQNSICTYGSSMPITSDNEMTSGIKKHELDILLKTAIENNMLQEVAPEEKDHFRDILSQEKNIALLNIEVDSEFSKNSSPSELDNMLNLQLNFTKKSNHDAQYPKAVRNVIAGCFDNRKTVIQAEQATKVMGKLSETLHLNKGTPTIVHQEILETMSLSQTVFSAQIEQNENRKTGYFSSSPNNSFQRDINEAIRFSEILDKNKNKHINSISKEFSKDVSTNNLNDNNDTD